MLFALLTKTEASKSPRRKSSPALRCVRTAFEGKAIESRPSRFAEASIHTRGQDPEIKAGGKSYGWGNTGPKTLPVKPEEKRRMPKMRTDLDWTAIQNERSEGASVAQLCKKYKVANSMIYTKTKASSNGTRVAGGGAKKTIPARTSRIGGSVTPPKTALGRFAPALDCLRSERDELNELIQKLEAMNG
jgi:hypothetical protein